MLLLFSHQVMSSSLQPHGLQHTKLLCPPLSPGVCSNTCPLSRWCYLSILPLPPPFSFCLQSFPSLGSFPVSWLLTSGSQTIGASASATVLPMNIQGWFPLFWQVWSPCSPRDSQEASPAPQFESINSSALSLFWPNSHICTWRLAKPQLWLYGPLLARWCLCFLIRCLGYCFPPRSKCLLISWLKSLSTVIFYILHLPLNLDSSSSLLWNSPKVTISLFINLTGHVLIHLSDLLFTVSNSNEDFLFKRLSLVALFLTYHIHLVLLCVPVQLISASGP